MQITSMHFKATASVKLRNANLQAALQRLQGNFVRGRAERVAELGNYEEIRTAAAAIRDRALANLDLYLAEFERNAVARGAVVHWAETRRGRQSHRVRDCAAPRREKGGASRSRW